MAGATWIAGKINSPTEFQGINAAVESDDIVFVQRDNKPDAYVGVIPTRRGDPAPLVSLEEVRGVCAQNPTVAMMIAIPRGARWSGTAINWLQGERIAFGGVGDLLRAISYDDEISTHRNQTFAFVDDGLRRHTRVQNLEWIDSKKVNTILLNNRAFVVALEDAYDITLSVARNASRTLGVFDILLKTNRNGSITSNGADYVDFLGFQTMKWGELLAYLARNSR